MLQVLAMGMSRYWIGNQEVETRFENPCFRVAESLDFFRGEPGVLERPDLFDDGDVNAQPVSSLKAFLDQGRIEGMIYARWGASKFPKHQFRGIADNKLDEGAVPSFAECLDGGKRILETHFIDMIRPALPKDVSQADIQALFKRATWIVNTLSSIYIRLAGTDSEVKRFPNEGPVLTQHGANLWTKWLTTNTKRDEEELQSAQTGEQVWFRRWLAKTHGDVENDQPDDPPRVADEPGNGPPAIKREHRPSVSFNEAFPSVGRGPPVIDADLDDPIDNREPAVKRERPSAGAASSSGGG